MSYSKQAARQIADSMVILVDTREQKWDHIKDFFDIEAIPYVRHKLDHGDYSFMIPANEKYGITEDMYFDDRIMIERKASLDELSGNFTRNRDRFVREMTGAPSNKVLMVEDAKYDDIVNHKYRSQFDSGAYIASLHAFWVKYDLPTFFVEKNYAWYFIYHHLHTYAQEYFRGELTNE